MSSQFSVHNFCYYCHSTGIACFNAPKKGALKCCPDCTHGFSGDYCQVPLSIVIGDE